MTVDRISATTLISEMLEAARWYIDDGNDVLIDAVIQVVGEESVLDRIGLGDVAEYIRNEIQLKPEDIFTWEELLEWASENIEGFEYLPDEHDPLDYLTRMEW